MTRPLRYFSALAALALLTALGPRSTHAQIVFDDFDDGDVTNVDVFFGGTEGVGAGVGPTDGFDGTAEAALSLGVNPGDGGGFAGAAVLSEAAVDAAAAEYLTFYIRPTLNQDNLPLVLEVNLQEDADGDGSYDGASEDEFQALYRLDLDGNATWQMVQIPLAAFTDDNSVNAGSDDGFDFSRVKNVVFAMGDIQGSEFNVSFDEIVFYEQAQMLPGALTLFDDFDDGNVEDVDVFFGGAEGVGAGVGLTDGRDGTENAALSLGINPGNGGGFAGAAVLGQAAVDAMGAEYLTFYMRPTTVQAENLPLVLEVNLQEDADSDGSYDGASEDEFQALYRISTGSGYSLVQIPLAAFTDDNSVNAGSDDGFDFSRVLNVVYAIGGIPAGPEFALAFDEIGFSAGVSVSNESPDALPTRSFASGVYPNPFVDHARLDVTLDRAEQVRVEVFDALGRRLVVLHEGRLAAGPAHTFRLDGRDLASGLYLVRVTGETFAQTRRVVLAR